MFIDTINILFPSLFERVVTIKNLRLYYHGKIDVGFFIRCEKGTYYALDLGGTNFRVLRVQLEGQRSSILEKDVERHSIPQHLMSSTSEVTDFVVKYYTNIKHFFKIF